MRVIAVIDGPRAVEKNRQKLPVDTLRQVWQHGSVMNESQNQFSFTRAAPSTSGRAKNQIPISFL
jgi:hypothetical protein